MLFNFISGAVVLCLMGISVIYNNKLTEIIGFIFGTISITTQIYLVCQLGDLFLQHVGFNENKYFACRRIYSNFFFHFTEYKHWSRSL